MTKYELPPCLAEQVERGAYRKWLKNRAQAHVQRDRKRGNTTATVSSYKQAIHKAVLDGGDRDYYTGQSLDWSLISQYDNVASKADGRVYKKRFADLPTVDHVGDGTGPADFAICSWRVNDCKNDLTHTEFLAVCRQVLTHAEAFAEV